MSSLIENSRRYVPKLTFSPLRVYKEGATIAGNPMTRLLMFTSVVSALTDDEVQAATDAQSDAAATQFLEKYRDIAKSDQPERLRNRALRELVGGTAGAAFNAVFEQVPTVVQPRLEQYRKDLNLYVERLQLVQYQINESQRRPLERAIALKQRQVAQLELALSRASQGIRQIQDDVPLEPLGLLFVERLALTPCEMERGELVYSLPLAPKEKVTLSHKEWRIVEEEFTQSVQDSLERYSERGVTTATELSISTNDVASRSDALRTSNTRRTGRTVHDGASNVTTTEQIDAQAAESVTERELSRTASVSESRTATELASSRSIQDHRVSFTVSTVAGSEDFTSRLLENPKDDHTMRVDYWRRMLRWRVRAERVGVRLTYAVVVPDPGFELRQPHLELQRLEVSLGQPFLFDLKPATIDATTAPALASTYGVVLPPFNAGAVAQWQAQVYEICRAAAWSRFSTAQETQRGRRDLLLKGVSNLDVFRLRRLEQEQLTFQVMKWLFPRLNTRYGHDEDAQQHSMEWGDVLEHGDYISFVHEALDWDNMLVSMYPYFWDTNAEAEGKLLLDHPDPVHREFLRAGAAKVVLSIRPGYEERVLSLLENGEIGELDAQHAFRKVITDVKAEHAKRLEGPDVLQEWDEFTPTGALDLDTVLRKVVVE